MKDSSLFKLKKAPYKWLRVEKCGFELEEALSIFDEGVNQMIISSFIDVTRIIQILSYKSATDPEYFINEGIGNNLIILNSTITGYNSGGFSTIITVETPTNFTFVDNKLIDAVWENDAIGLLYSSKEIYNT